MRASELVRDDSSEAAKRREETIAVAWDARRRCPASFEREARAYRIDAVIQVWAVERFWWNPRKRISRRYWRVIARGGTYDLAYDRLERRWLLLGVAGLRGRDGRLRPPARPLALQLHGRCERS